MADDNQADTSEEFNVGDAVTASSKDDAITGSGTEELTTENKKENDKGNSIGRHAASFFYSPTLENDKDAPSKEPDKTAPARSK